jgi:hypothetical protein
MKPNEHVTAWIEPYLDGELSERRHEMVEAHLLTCEKCKNETESLSRLSSLVKGVPSARNLAPPEIFVAQVGLQLTRQPERSALHRTLQNGWRVAPFGIMGSWAFLQAALIVAGILTWGLRFIPGGDQIIGMLPSSSGSALAGMFNLPAQNVLDLGRFGLDLFRSSGLLGWGITLNLGLTIIIGLLYLSWLASWWVQQTTNQESVPSNGH